jgi:hypothetical protein
MAGFSHRYASIEARRADSLDAPRPRVILSDHSMVDRGHDLLT